MQQPTQYIPHESTRVLPREFVRAVADLLQTYPLELRRELDHSRFDAVPAIQGQEATPFRSQVRIPKEREDDASEMT